MGCFVSKEYTTFTWI